MAPVRTCTTVCALVFWLSHVAYAQPKVVPRVAIVSEEKFHLEVVAGFAGTLAKDFGRSLKIYLCEGNNDHGLIKFLDIKLQPLPLPELGSGFQENFDLVIFISPEYGFDRTQAFLSMVSAKVVLAVVHEAASSMSQHIGNIVRLKEIHPNVHLTTLAPHVQYYLARRLKTNVHWMLPIHGLISNSTCNATTCLNGFVIQGKVQNGRRDYKQAFRDLEGVLQSPSGRDPRAQLHLIGHVDPDGKVVIPPQLSKSIHIHSDLRMPEFYKAIQSKLGLMLAFAHDRYYESTFTSSVISSLVTGVPIIANDRFLKTYTFLTQEHVLHQKNNESMVDVLQRVLSFGDAELSPPRQALAQLRVQLRQEAVDKITALLIPFMPQIQEEWESKPW